MTRNLDGSGLFLRQIQQYPLLTPDQERQYGSQIQAMMELQKVQGMLEKELGQYPSNSELAIAANLTEVEVQQIIHRGRRAKERMIQSNLRLVVMIAKKYQNRELPLDDLIQEGSIGLARGAEKFDPSKGYKFSTYAYWWIRQAITRAILNKATAIRIPVYVSEAKNRIKKATRLFCTEFGRYPTCQELRDRLAETDRKILEDPVAMRKPLSLDCPLRSKAGQDHEVTLGSAIHEDLEVSDPYNFAILEETKDQISKMFASLNPTEQSVLRSRFGLDGEGEKTLRAIGVAHGFTHERARQIEKNAKRKCKRKCRIA